MHELDLPKAHPLGFTQLLAGPKTEIKNISEWIAYNIVMVVEVDASS
jgi:hypothetical protein